MQGGEGPAYHLAVFYVQNAVLSSFFLCQMENGKKNNLRAGESVLSPNVIIHGREEGCIVKYAS